MPLVHLSDEEMSVIEDLRKQTPRLASEYTTEDKLRIFDQFHAMALNIFNEVNEERECDENHKQQAWEAMMQLLARDGKFLEFWKIFNKMVA